jgi:hypothetical protein
MAGKGLECKVRKILPAFDGWTRWASSSGLVGSPAEFVAQAADFAIEPCARLVEPPADLAAQAAGFVTASWRLAMSLLLLSKSSDAFPSPRLPKRLRQGSS